MNSSEVTITPDLADLFLISGVDNQTINSDCSLANQTILEYSKCFTTAASLSNHTAQVVKAVDADGLRVFVALVEEIVGEQALKVQHEEKGLMIFAARHFAKNIFQLC